MKPLIAVAVSGGVDSLMAAALLKTQGYPVFGIHFLTGFEPENRDVAAVTDQLGIPLHVVDLADAFRTRVVEYFLQTYMVGKTPNPCLVCNPVVKFGILFEHARHLGADRLATGHYARIVPDTHQQPHLFMGVDRRKDQSYFLAFLTRHQLARACFPLGEMKKSDVKELAVLEGLHPVTHKESQDACFISSHRYTEFLADQLGVVPSPGEIVDREGRVLGRHTGLHGYTIGQRRGINCPAAEPYYVLRLDTQKNRLVVGPRRDTLSSGCRVQGINWIQAEPSEPMRVYTRVRYRHTAVPSTLTPQPQQQAIIGFDAPQSAITPGQGAVFYIGEEVIGGGWICGDS
ncbi:MAG: tRNA 2-thiouridine(34) synthase MnmA [Desulfobacterales bacterium]|jgi:tRNA-specific 2-thiouridylase